MRLLLSTLCLLKLRVCNLGMAFKMLKCTVPPTLLPLPSTNSVVITFTEVKSPQLVPNLMQLHQGYAI